MATPRVLCVDDDPLALEQVKNALKETATPLDCRFFGSPTRARSAHQELPADIVISDLKMGSTDGLTLIEEMREFAPDTVYMLLSAEADLESALLAVNKVQVFRFLTKPAQGAKIRAAIEAALTELEEVKLRAAAYSTLNAIEKKNTAVATIDADGKILFANAPANEILSDNAVFAVFDDKVLRSADVETTKAFKGFLKALATSAPEQNQGSLFRFPRPNGEHAVIVSAVHFGGGDGLAPHYSLLFSDPERCNPIDSGAIATALHLTPSEARVVHGLVLGGGVPEAAKHAGVSLSTARSYLKSVFHKTGVSKQADLVRLALVSAA